MMKTFTKNTSFLFLLMAFVLVSCVPGNDTAPLPTTTQTSQPTLAPTETSTPTEMPTPTATPLPLNGQQTRYEIDLMIDYYNQFITVTSRSSYTNKTNTPINDIVFIVYPTIFENAIYIKSVKTGAGDPVTNFTWESHRMRIPLESSLLPGEQIEFVHEFELYMPSREGVFGQTGRQLNLAYWYPFIPPYDEEEGWLAYEIAITNSLIVGDHLVFETSDFDVTLQFTDRRENLKIAAGTLPEEADGVLHYSLPLARTFAMVISDRYTVIEREVDGIAVKAYTFTEDLISGEAVADLAEKALRLYSELYGPYNREVISIVEADIGIGMEFDGIYLMLSSFYWYYNGTSKTDLTIIVPHEMSHQWFFSQVGNNQALEPWLDEAFATYSEALFYERYYPDELDWWWDTRVYSHLPYGYIDGTIYMEGGVPEYFDTVYRIGAMFVQDLRELMGEEDFFAFLKDYVQTYQYEIVTHDDFWETLRQHTDQDLTALYTEYFAAPAE